MNVLFWLQTNNRKNPFASGCRGISAKRTINTPPDLLLNLIANNAFARTSGETQRQTDESRAPASFNLRRANDLSNANRQPTFYFLEVV